MDVALVKTKARCVLFYTIIEHLYTTLIHDVTKTVKMVDRIAECPSGIDCETIVRASLSTFYEDLNTIADPMQRENLQIITRHFMNTTNPLELMAAMVKSMPYFDLLIFVNPALTRHIMTSI